MVVESKDLGKGNKSGISASTDVPTLRRDEVLTRIGYAEEEKRGLLAVSVSYFQWLLLFKPLMKHPEWFDRDFELTLEVMKDDEEIKQSPIYLIAEKFFNDYALDNRNPDDNPKNKLNFFRGNFHTKLFIQVGMAKVLTDISSFLGDRQGEVENSLAELKSRIDTRKQLSQTIDHLEKEIKKDIQNRIMSERRHSKHIHKGEDKELSAEPIKLLTREERENYRLRIQESKGLEKVTPDEANKAFDVAELFRHILLDSLGRENMSQDEKDILINNVTKKFESEKPQPISSLRSNFREQQPLED